MTPADPALIDACPTPAAPPADAAAQARALIHRQLAMLSELAEMGMEVAEACRRDAVAQAAEPGEAMPRRDPGLTFARVARAVRMTIALQSRLMKDLAELDEADARTERRLKDRRRMRLSRLAGAAARAAVVARRAAEDPVEAWGRSDDEAVVENEIERLAYKAYERLTEVEDGELGDLSFDAAVAAICADLGVSSDWTARLKAAMKPPPAAAGGEAGRVAPDPPRWPAWATPATTGDQAWPPPQAILGPAPDWNPAIGSG